MRIVAFSKKNFSKVVLEAASALKKGKVLVFPTDTIYGLVADATNKRAVRRVFLIKGRKGGKPLPIFVGSVAMAKQLARVSLRQEKLLKKSWPGKVTMVLESRGKLPRETGTASYIGLRIPKHPFLQRILKKVGLPLTGTSANLADSPSLSNSRDIVKTFQKRRYQPDLLIDAGKLPSSRPSRVIDITGIKPKVLRK
ncbi:MAG: L-threonylcarbamoyladenylate synthase [bacterium]|nr:L-threonylcarbamoyladenylate synthase [bacterium]